MTHSPNPTWYDILGVGRDATPEQVKAAWRAATDKFEPGSGTSQFRLFNEAADVLLDPDRRAAYDAGLAADTGPADEPAEVVAVEPAGTESTIETAEETRATDAVAEPAPPSPPPNLEPDPSESSATRSGGVLGWFESRFAWVVLVCAPVLVASLVAALVSVFGVHVWKADAEGLLPTVRTFDAGPDASAAAERALKAVLSYDYRHMEADRDRAVQFLTPSYKKDYLKTFNDLLTKGPDGSPGPVEKTQAVVTADVLDTGVVDAEADRVRVIAFVNQSSAKGEAQPTVFQNRVVATMVRRGDRWLVDNLASY